MPDLASAAAPRWERKGTCNHCGYCCQYIGPVAVVLDREPGQDLDPAFWRLREPVLATAARVGIIYHAFLPCSAHDPAAKACRAYDARPATCHAFPSEPGQVEGTPCSYYFEQDGVRRGGQGSPFPTPSRLLTLRPHA